MQHAVTHWNTLQHTATRCNAHLYKHLHAKQILYSHIYTISQCITLQHSTLQHNFTHTLQNIATHCNKIQLTATHGITLQHTATDCNTHLRKLPQAHRTLLFTAKFGTVTVTVARWAVGVWSPDTGPVISALLSHRNIHICVYMYVYVSYK